MTSGVASIELGQWIHLHEAGLEQLRIFWPIGILLLLVEIFLLQKSKHFTQRGATEATVSTAVFFLLLLSALTYASAVGLIRAAISPGPQDLLLFVLSAAGVVLLRAILLRAFFQGRTYWQVVASAPLPFFTYFTAWIFLK